MNYCKNKSHVNNWYFAIRIYIWIGTPLWLFWCRKQNVGLIFFYFFGIRICSTKREMFIIVRHCIESETINVPPSAIVLILELTVTNSIYRNEFLFCSFDRWRIVNIYIYADDGFRKYIKRPEKYIILLRRAHIAEQLDKKRKKMIIFCTSVELCYRCRWFLKMMKCVPYACVPFA